MKVDTYVGRSIYYLNDDQIRFGTVRNESIHDGWKHLRVEWANGEVPRSTLTKLTTKGHSWIRVDKAILFNKKDLIKSIKNC